MTNETRVPFPGDASASALLNRLNDKKPPRPAAVPATLKYEVELITPLFGGGVKPGENDANLPVRMKALRGQLRFWWRVLAAYGGFQDCGLSAQTNGSVLYEAETARWGGAGENGKPIPGRIGLHVHVPNLRGFSNPVKFEDRDPRTGKYRTARPFYDVNRAIEYALFPAKHGEQDSSDPKKLVLPKEWEGKNENVSFALEILVLAGAALEANQIAEELRRTVAWWATFGGIGARWRRGTGSVRVHRVHNETRELLCVLDGDPNNPCSLPSLKEVCGIRLSARPDCKIAKGAWVQAVWRLRAFRQDPEPGIGRGGSLRSDPKVYKQSFWPEPHLARHHHGPTTKWAHDAEARFINGGPAAYVARGALGLPLAIKFPPRKYRLKLVLEEEGRNSVMVTFVGNDLHVRIFDAKGKRAVDKTEDELVSGRELTDLKTQIRSVPANGRLPRYAEQKIIENATLVSGHIEPPDTNFFPHDSNSKRMASPLILRAVARRNGKFTPCALLLPWWRDTLGVTLAAEPDDGLGAPATGYRVWPDDPAARVAAAAKIPPILKNQPPGTVDPDPLSAFMVFFSE